MKKAILSIWAITALGLIANAQWVQIGNDLDGDTAAELSGYSVSLNDDGSIVAIGAISNNDNGSEAGQVRIYQDNGGNWAQIGDGINGEDPLDKFGNAVSLSGNGNRVAIGAQYNNGINGSFSGHVRIHEYDGNVWTQVGNDIDGEAFADESGVAVSISNDGGIVAIGAWNNDGVNGANSGHVRVYMDSSGNWVQLGADIDGTTFVGGSGDAVSLSSDGNTVAIGARAPGNSAGQVRIFNYASNVWTQIGVDIDGEAGSDDSGCSVSLSDDGSIVAIGAFRNDGVNGPESGHVRVYENISSVWTQVGDDIDGEDDGDKSGWSVSLSGDGNLVAIGAPYNGGNPFAAGHVRIYQNISSVWTQVGTDIDGEAASDHSGRAVSLSADGSVVAIGAYENDGNGMSAGHVRIYTTGSIGIPEMDPSGISVYPNPTTGLINVAVDATEQNNTVNIYNTLGALIHTERLSAVSIYKFQLPDTKGLYLIQMVTEKGEVLTARVTKE